MEVDVSLKNGLVETCIARESLLSKIIRCASRANAHDSHVAPGIVWKSSFRIGVFVLFFFWSWLAHHITGEREERLAFASHCTQLPISLVLSTATAARVAAAAANAAPSRIRLDGSQPARRSAPPMPVLEGEGSF